MKMGAETLHTNLEKHKDLFTLQKQNIYRCFPFVIQTFRVNTF